MSFVQNFTPGSETNFQGYVSRIQNRTTTPNEKHPQGMKVCNISSSEGVNGSKTLWDITVWGHLDEEVVKVNSKVGFKGHCYPQGRYKNFPDTPMRTDSEAFLQWLKANPPWVKMAMNARQCFIFRDDGSVEELSVIK